LLLLSWSRFTALVFAIGLGVGEAVINWGNWQYAPLWIVDYIVVAWLLTGFYKTRSGRHLPWLISGWAFTAGVFYMALFASLDPGLSMYIKPSRSILMLMGLMLMLSVSGILSAALAYRNER
jgi:hypothetical protein